MDRNSQRSQQRVVLQPQQAKNPNKIKQEKISEIQINTRKSSPFHKQQESRSHGGKRAKEP